MLDSNIYDGEVYDATREDPDWNAAGLDDRRWQPANVVEAPGGVMVSQLPSSPHADHRTDASRRHPIYQPGIPDRQPRCATFQAGSNSASPGPRHPPDGWFAEGRLFHPDGTLDPTSNERARSTDTFVLKGEGTEFCKPRFPPRFSVCRDHRRSRKDRPERRHRMFRSHRLPTHGFLRVRQRSDQQPSIAQLGGLSVPACSGIPPIAATR